MAKTTASRALGKHLRDLRGTATLKELASATRFSVSYLSDLETGRTLPSLSTLVALANVHSLTVAQLLAPVDLGENARHGEPLPFDETK